MVTKARTAGTAAMGISRVSPIWDASIREGMRCEPRLRRAFLHLRLCVFAARTIENEYLRNPFDVQDGADKIHRLRQWHIGGADRSAQGI